MTHAAEPGPMTAIGRLVKVYPRWEMLQALHPTAQVLVDWLIENHGEPEIGWNNHGGFGADGFIWGKLAKIYWSPYCGTPKLSILGERGVELDEGDLQTLLARTISRLKGYVRL